METAQQESGSSSDIIAGLSSSDIDFSPIDESSPLEGLGLPARKGQRWQGEDALSILARGIRETGVEALTRSSAGILTLEDLLRKIHSNPVGEQFDSLSATLAPHGIAPIIAATAEQKRIIFAVRESIPNQEPETRLVHSVEMVLETQMRFLGLQSNDIALLILSNEEYDFMHKLLTNPAKRADYLADINPETTALKAYYAILQTGVRDGASDVHVEPYQQGYRIRYRIDGKLKVQSSVSMEVGKELVTIIKNNAKLDISQKRRPQDGGTSFEQSEINQYPLLDRLSLRVSTTMVQPSANEKVVIRYLRAASIGEFKLENLGFAKPIANALHSEIETPKGLLLVTGPTGSGKTTTLYSLLTKLNTPDVNICTVEDPVEMYFPGMNQTSVNKKAGIDFADQLRSFMRQDPDIMLIGEIRDEETAQIAIKAATTGHFVLSTLHTNSAFGTILRLYSLNVGGSELQDSLKAILSQRLVRECCPDCSEEYDARDELNKLLELDKGSAIKDPVLLRTPASSDAASNCGSCRGAGYSGRIVVPELWQIGDEERELIYKGHTNTQTFLEIAAKRGMRPIWYAGVELLLEGKTSIPEILQQVASRAELAKQKATLAKLIRSKSKKES